MARKFRTPEYRASELKKRKDIVRSKFKNFDWKSHFILKGETL